MGNFRCTLRALMIGLGLLPLVAVAQDNADFSDIEPIELRLAHVVNEQDGFHIAAEKFKTLVEERTDGTVSVALYPNAQLGDERTLLRACRSARLTWG